MRRGPKPKPAAVKAQKKAVRSRQQGHPQYASAMPTGAPVSPPAWLKKHGLEIWKRLAPRLVEAKLLGDTDRETFARYCRNFARWLAMQNALDKGTVTYSIETDSGVVHRARPEFAIGDRIERMLMAAEDRFGLNPAERQRIYAARANLNLGSDDLFRPKDRGPNDPATPATEPAEPTENPVGYLN